MGNIGPSAIPALIQSFKSTDRYENNEAGWALARIGAAAVLPLVEALNHDDRNLRSRAAWRLGDIGPPAKAAVPVLQQLVKSDPDHEVRLSAEVALIRIEGRLRY